MADLPEGFVRVDPRVTDKPVKFVELSVRQFTDACRRARGLGGELDGQELSIYIAYYSMRDESGELAIASLDDFLNLPWSAVRPITELAAAANRPPAEGNS